MEKLLRPKHPKKFSTDSRIKQSKKNIHFKSILMINDNFNIDESAVQAAAQSLFNSPYTIALVGAGISVESGIPTFRGPGGLWTKLGEPSGNGYEDFLKNPESWWLQNLDQQADPERTKFREAIDKATPNKGHYALVDLEKMGELQHQITQNVDDLHFKAGSKSVTEIHGNRTMLRCIGCETRWHRSGFPTGEIVPSITGPSNNFPPMCPDCGSPVKSDTVMFGEPIPRGTLDSCFLQSSKATCIIVIGTSATVYPAASFPQDIQAAGGILIEANPNETPLTGIADITLRGPTAITLPALVDTVNLIKAESR